MFLEYSKILYQLTICLKKGFYHIFNLYQFFLLSEMKQREGHFLHLAEETAALKDQVDALRELSVITLKSDNSIMDNGVSRNAGMSDKEAKAHAAAGNIRLHVYHWQS